MTIMKTNRNSNLPSVYSFDSLVDHLFSNFFNISNCYAFEGDDYPLIDAYSIGDEFIMEATITGYNKEDVDVELNSKDRSIKFSSKKNQKLDVDQKDKRYYVKERKQSSFMRKLRLPDLVDINDYSTKFENGVFTLKFKLKKEEDGIKKIEIR